MSGGSMNYAYLQLEEYADMMKDPVIIALAKDFVEVLHDCEWMHSGDIGEGYYNKTVMDFKEKWLSEKYPQTLAGIIEQRLSETKTELLNMIGKAPMCRDCKHWEQGECSEFGDCKCCTGYMMHGYDFACEKMEEKHEKS